MQEKMQAVILSLANRSSKDFFKSISTEINTLLESDLLFINFIDVQHQYIQTISADGQAFSTAPVLATLHDFTATADVAFFGTVDPSHYVYYGHWLFNEHRDIIGSIIALGISNHNIPLASDLFTRIATRLTAEIHQVKQTEIANRELRRLRFALDTVNLGVYHWNVTTDVVLFDSRLYDILGYQEGEFEMNFNGWKSAIHPEDVEAQEDRIKNNVGKEKRPHAPATYRIRTKNGSYKWIEVNSYSYHDPVDGSVYYIGTVKDVDESVRATEQLRQLHERIEQREKVYEFALKVGNLGVFDWDVEQGKVVMSAKVAEMLGYEANEFEIRFDALMTLIHPDDSWQFTWESFHQQAARSQHTLNIYRIRDTKGEYRWVEAQNMVVHKNAIGHFTRMIGIVKDLDEEKRINDELIASFEKQQELNKKIKYQSTQLSSSEQKWLYALEGHGDGVVEWDIANDVSVFSPRAQKILGFPLDTRESIKKFMDHIHPEMRQEFTSFFQMSLKPPFRPFEMEVRVLDTFNNYNWVMFRGKVVEQSNEGKPLRMVGTVSDVSAQKIFQKEFTIYEEMIKQNQSAILFISMSGSIEFVNNVVAEWLDYRKHEILEKHISFLMPEFQSGVQQPENYRGITHLITKAGSAVVAQVAISTLQVEGETIGYVLNLIDITEKKKLEDEITALKVSQLEAKLQSQRRQTELMIQVQENEKGHIARELHDGVGQLLSLAKLQLAQLTRGLDNNSAEEAKTLNDLIQQIAIDVKGITSELMPLSLRKLGLESAIKSLLEHYKRVSGKEMDISCKINLDGYEPESFTAIHLYRIAQEALNNMMKYSGATTVSVMLMKLKNSINLLIEDNGKGFDVALQSNRENSFGLKTMHERANLIHAKLLISSAENAGTTISLTVPITIPS